MLSSHLLVTGVHRFRDFYKQIEKFINKKNVVTSLVTTAVTSLPSSQVFFL